jgi:CheY-like chemotaxis protein
MKKPAILAVDDTPGNLVALEAVLDEKFDIVPAESGMKAIEILKHRSDIAVILMDIQMPIMDGYEAAQRIKRIPGCQDIPIVFITAVFHEDRPATASGTGRRFAQWRDARGEASQSRTAD